MSSNCRSGSRQKQDSWGRFRKPPATLPPDNTAALATAFRPNHSSSDFLGGLTEVDLKRRELYLTVVVNNEERKKQGKNQNNTKKQQSNCERQQKIVKDSSFVLFRYLKLQNI